MAQKEMTRITEERISEIISRIEMYGHGAGYTADEVLEIAQQMLALRQKEQHESNTCRLNFEQWLEQQRGKIDVDCGCVSTETFMHWLRVAYEAGNYPDIPDSSAQAPGKGASPESGFELSRMFTVNWLTASTIQRSSVLAPSNYGKELAAFWAKLLHQIVINKPRKAVWKGVILKRH